MRRRPRAKSVLDKGMNFPFLSVSLNRKILHVRSECFPSSAQVAVWRRAMPMMIQVNSVMGHSVFVERFRARLSP